MYEPRKRTALDGRVWWCVYDTTAQRYSTLLHFGKYRTRRACQAAIDAHQTPGGNRRREPKEGAHNMFLTPEMQRIIRQIDEIDRTAEARSDNPFLATYTAEERAKLDELHTAYKAAKAAAGL